MPFSVQNLRLDYLQNPLGIDELFPRFSWEVYSPRRGAGQSAWRILVASSPALLGEDSKPDLWDSGKVVDGQTCHIVYAGKPLRSRQLCHWRVIVWDDRGVRHLSIPARFSVGLLDAAEWKARWIGIDPACIAADPQGRESTLTQSGTPAYFHRDFEVPQGVIRATLYFTARGIAEMHLNGERVGDDQFSPEWTDYRKRIQYRTYDVTALVKPGSNALGAILGDGWYSGYVGWQETRGRYGLDNALLAQLELELADGRIMTVQTDPSWQAGTGALLMSDFMMGEQHDSRREHAGWAKAGFSSPAWRQARELSFPLVPLVAQRSEPVRVTEQLEPVSAREVSPGTWLFDFGQNISGWLRLRVEGPAGTKLVLRHGERLTPEGALYTENLRRATATDTWLLAGVEGGESWQPRFTFHGFQYAEISGLPQAPAEGSIVACVVHSATPPAGHFECSHAGVNRLWQNGLWSQRDNFLSVPTDCPQRDERLGWMGDAQVFMRTATCNMDVAGFFTKWMIDVEDAQTPEGIFPDVAPRVDESTNFVGLDGLGGAAGWADAGIIIPYTLWRVYGDTRVVERHWKAMCAWLDYLDRTNPDGLRVNELANNYGDWLCIPADTTFRTHSPMKNLLATAYWADDAAKMARMADALGRDEDRKRFEEMFLRVRAAFRDAYIDDEGRMEVETQTAYLLALSMNLMPEHLVSDATNHLVENIAAQGWHLSTGFIGISHLNPTLTLNGRNDVAYRLLLTEDYPSWLYPVRHGATTIWERWNGWTAEEGFFNPHMNSFNHYSLGSVGEWLFRHVAGIELDPVEAGYSRFVLRPWIGKGLDHAKATLRTLHGEIASAWRHDGAHLSWEFTVPANTTARVYIPTLTPDKVQESGEPLENSQGLRVLGPESGFLVCEAEAGTYRVTC